MELYTDFFCGVLWWNTVCVKEAGAPDRKEKKDAFSNLLADFILIYEFLFLRNIQYIYFIYLFILRIYFYRYEIK